MSKDFAVIGLGMRTSVRDRMSAVCESIQLYLLCVVLRQWPCDFSRGRLSIPSNVASFGIRIIALVTYSMKSYEVLRPIRRRKLVDRMACEAKRVTRRKICGPKATH
ncbi:hypothetical protein LIA77_10463 [Sarocladium implicatum]|nr:hypothetical protein LIA77_10463 [Sarocladium implicatum]